MLICLLQRDKFKKITQQPANVIVDNLHNSVYDDTNMLKYQCLNSTATIATHHSPAGNNNHQTIIDPQVMINTSDDGRINYSNKAPLNIATKHVVNMLGKCLCVCGCHK